MNKQRRFVAALIGLCCICLVVLGFLVRAHLQNHAWENEMFAMAALAGSLQARADYERGNLQLYEVAADSEMKATGRSEGPFQIWTWPFHSMLGQPNKFAAEQFVKSYNTKMKYMRQHPDQFPVHHDA
jgi:hypothetical protein